MQSLPLLRPPSSSPPCTALPSPLRRSPLRPAFLAPHAAATPQAAALPRREIFYLAPLRVAREWPPPLAATAPPLTRRCAALAGGGLPRRWRGCGWNSLADARSPCASGVALGVKIGGVLRGVLPRSSALRASGGGARVFPLLILSNIFLSRP